MTDNKTKPTNVSLDTFLSTVSDKRRQEARVLIDIMRQISNKKPTMWGPSIIGFGSQHYKYDTGREGDMPMLAFSPRKSAITIYFGEGFDRYFSNMQKLGKHKASVACLYVNKLDDIDIGVLRKMLKQSFQLGDSTLSKPTTVEEYVGRIPRAAKPQFDKLRTLVKRAIPKPEEVLSYGIVGYKIDEKRARIYISGWKDHVAIYPIPKDESLRNELKKFVKGKGTLWFDLDKPLPAELIQKIVKSLIV